jgi:hypothetical protein
MDCGIGEERPKGGAAIDVGRQCAYSKDASGGNKSSGMTYICTVNDQAPIFRS